MQPGSRNQGGIALLTFVILVALAAITYYFATISPVELKIDRQQQTRLILKQAKQALIAHAITHADQPGDAGEFGDLPCPDFQLTLPPFGEGVADGGACGGNLVVTTGYLPWRSLGIDALKDSSGTCLYYAVSPSYKITNNVVMLNEDTNGMIQIVDSTGAVITGATADERPVAVVLAAGAALANQNRMPNDTSICGEDYSNASAYLDSYGTIDNSIATTADNEIKKFISASPGSENKPQPVNDQLITISRADIWRAVLKRKDFQIEMNNLTQAIALCLVEYAADNTGRRLPWPAPLDLTAAGADYKDNDSYDDAAATDSLYAGRVPYTIDDSTIASSAKDPSTGSAITTLFGPAAPSACKDLTVTVQLPGSGTIHVDLTDLSSKYGKLWQNWKDHFFYAISKVYQPVSGVSTESQCYPPLLPTLNSCIKVAGVPYAGIVFYSGSRLSGQSRDAPIAVGDNDDKAVISNYLENGNDGIFPGATGTQADTYNTNGPDPTIENDVMWCIKNAPASTTPPSKLTVTPC